MVCPNFSIPSCSFTNALQALYSIPTVLCACIFFLEGGSNRAPLNVWKLSQFDVQDCLIWCRVISTAFLYNFFYCTVVNSMQHHTATSNATCITNCVVSIAVIFSGCHAMLPLCCVTSHGCKGDYKLWKGNSFLFTQWMFDCSCICVSRWVNFTPECYPH